MLKLYVRYCSAMLLDLCPRVLFFRNTKIFTWVLASYVLSIWGSHARMEATFWARSEPSWPSWAPLKYLEATATLLGAKLGDLEGKFGHREVMLGYVMLC